MSTRSAIARGYGDGFRGVYHHWDGYPTALGATLWNLYHGHFQRDLSAMLRTLIDEHPAGWSTVNDKNFDLEPGFDDWPLIKTEAETQRPLCYCHGDRHEEPQPVDETTDAGMEWAYVFDEDRNTMAVFERRYRDEPDVHMVGMFGMGAEGNQFWMLREVFDLDGFEPDWEELEGRES